mmetsp:Transcript_10175/g.20720  ORF Transcript_10175/g.20720 Transcript_10175/m.20720 type:complete len:124 (-) Transcript_10175:746-1117(-)
MTRSFSNYLSTFDQPSSSSPILEGSASEAQQHPASSAAAAPPMVGSMPSLPSLDRQRSRSAGGVPSASRENSGIALLGGQGPDSFMRDLFDVSATLEPPPPEMVPPGIASRQDSFGGLLDGLK